MLAMPSYSVSQNLPKPYISRVASRTISILCHTVSKNIMAVGVSVGVKSIFDDHTTPPKHSLGFDTVKKIVLGVQNRILNSSSGFLLSNK